MALLGQLLGNAFSDNPQSTGDVMSNYFSNRINQDMNVFGNTRARNDQMGNQPSGPAVPGQIPEIAGTQANVANVANVAPMNATITNAPVAPQQTFQPYQVATNGPTPPPPQLAQAQNVAAQPPGGPAVPTPATAGQVNLANSSQLMNGQPNPGTGPIPLGPSAQAPVAPGQTVPLPPARPVNLNAQAPLPPVGPVNPAQPAPVAQAPAAAPAPAQTAPAVTPGGAEDQHDKIIQATKIQDPAQRISALRMLAANPNMDEGNRNLATQMMLENFQQQQQTQKNLQQLQTMTPNDLARQMKSNTEEGNWFKYYIANRLGLTAMADNEANKLGYKNVTDSETLSGPNGLQRYTVTRDGRGNVVRAFDTAGNAIDQDTLSQLSAQAFPGKGTEVGTSAFKDLKTGNIYYQRRLPNGSWQYVDQNGQSAPPGANLHPYGIGSDIEVKNQIDLNKLQNKLAYAPVTERAKIIAAHEAEYGPLDPAVKNQLMSNPTGVPGPGGVVGTIPSSIPNNGIAVTGAAGAAPVPPGGAPAPGAKVQAGTDLSSGLQGKIASGYRSQAEQKALYDETVAAGRPGIGPTGLPVAQNASTHNAGVAIDLPRNLSRAERQELQQKGYYQPDPVKDPVHWEKVPGYTPAPGTPGAITTPATAGQPGLYPGQIKQGMTLGTKQGETNIQTTAEQQRKFNENADTLSSAGATAQTTADLRRQMNTLLMDPRSPIGFAQGQSSAPKTQLFQDIVAGNYTGEHGAALADDIVKATGFKQGSPEYNNIVQFANLQGQIMARSGALKSEFGNRVSNLDVQLFNKTAGGDMLRSPAYALFATNENNIIADDLTSARGDMASSGNYNSTPQFNRDWKAKQAQLENIVKQVKESRLQYIQSLPGGVTNPTNVRAGFAAYPTPTYDTTTGTYQLNKASQAVVNQGSINPSSKEKLDAIRKKQQGQ